jgi:hypothetical protein
MFENKIYFFAIIIAIIGIIFGILQNNDDKSNGSSSLELQHRSLELQERQTKAIENISRQLETIANTNKK